MYGSNTIVRISIKVTIELKKILLSTLLKVKAATTPSNTMISNDM